MHFLWNTFCVIVAAVSVAKEDSTQVVPSATPNRGVATNVLPFEDINIFDPLPAYTNVMSDEMFVKWAKTHNLMVYRLAQQRADEWNARNPVLDLYVQESDYTSTSGLNQNESGTPNSSSVDASSTTNYDGKNIQRTYRSSDVWGGGPVVIINPYFRGN